MAQGAQPMGYEAIAITPSDTVDVNVNAVYVGGAGNLTIMNNAGVSVLFTAPPVGSVIPCFAKRVMATGTTATALVGLV